MGVWILAQLKINKLGFALIVFCSALYFFQPKAWRSTHFVTMSLYGNFPWMFGFLALAVANSGVLSYGTLCYAILFSALAAVSGTPGIPTIAFVALLIFLRSADRGHRLSAVIATVATLSAFAYLLSVSAMASQAEVNLSDRFEGATIFNRLVGFAAFFFQLLGAYWTPSESLALATGVLGMLASVFLGGYFLIKRDFGMAVLNLYVVCAPLTVAVGRYAGSLALAFEWRFWTFTEVYWLVLPISAIVFIYRVRFPGFRVALTAVSLSSLVYCLISHRVATPEMADFKALQEREIVDLAIGQDGIYEDYWLGPSITQLALKYAESDAYSFRQSMSDYAQAQVVSTCSRRGAELVTDEFEKVVGNKFPAAYVKLQAKMPLSQASKCHFMACQSDEVLSFDARVYQDIGARIQLPDQAKELYWVTAIIDREFESRVNELHCTAD